MTGPNYRVDGPVHSWRGQANGWHMSAVMLGSAAAMSLAAVALTVAGERATGTGLAALAITSAVLLGFAAVRCLGDAVAACLVVTRIDGAGVDIRPGLIPLSAMHIPLAHIREAQAASEPARPWSSWGWWLSAQLTPTVLVRSGPALALELTSGRRITISVNDPGSAVTALSDAKIASGLAHGTR